MGERFRRKQHQRKNVGWGGGSYSLPSPSLSVAPDQGIFADVIVNVLFY